MPVYKRQRGNPAPLHQAQITFEALWRQLDFKELMTYPGNQHALLTWMSEHPAGAADLAAAVFAQVHYRKPVDDLLRQGLTYCELMVEEAGYEPTSLRQLAEESSSIENHVVLVAGCQGRETLKARARAAYLLVRGMPTTPFTLVFSGKNPAQAGSGIKVQTPNEALLMQMEFQRLIDNDPSLNSRRGIDTLLENQSSKSEENIGNFFRSGYLRPDKRTAIYLVSSTFHIPRLAAIADATLAQSDRLPQVQRTVLMAAEDSLEESPVVRTASYVKWMMFVVFDHMLRNSPRGFAFRPVSAPISMMPASDTQRA